MVLPAPPAHASPVEPHWFDKVVVAIELSAHGVLTLVDHAAPSRLREAFLRLRARDPETDLIVDVQRLAELSPGTTVILAVTPSMNSEDLDWLNLNRPLVSDRRLNIVLWCEGDAAAVLARGAPDFFDWISARVDCPPAPAAFAVSDVKAAIRARAPGIAWAGPGLEETLAAVRRSRPIRHVAVASYQSMIDALTSRERGWLFLYGIDTQFHLRRLRWAVAESGRRVIVFRRSIDRTLPGWWTVHATHVPIRDAVRGLGETGGDGRLAALTGLDVVVHALAAFLLRQKIWPAYLEALLATTSDPRATLQELVLSQRWSLASAFTEQPWHQASIAMRQALEDEPARHERDDDQVVVALRGQPLDSEQWIKLGTAAIDEGDFEVAIRWLTAALQLLPSSASDLVLATVLTQRGRAYHRAGDLALACADLRRAGPVARRSGDAATIVKSGARLGHVLLDQGEPLPAQQSLESALHASAKLSDDDDKAYLLDMLAVSLLLQHDFVGARKHLERALSIKRRVHATEAHPSIAVSLRALGGVLAAQGDLGLARMHLERSLEISEQLGWQEGTDIAATLQILARIHRDTGDLLAARRCLDRALAIQRVALGPDHPDTANTLVLLGDVLTAAGELDAAREALDRALAIQQKALGGDGQLAGAMTRRKLARALTAKGDLTGAVENLQQALATQRRLLERDDHPDIVATQRELERLQALQRDVQRVD